MFFKCKTSRSFYLNVKTIMEHNECITDIYYLIVLYILKIVFVFISNMIIVINFIRTTI